LFFSIDALRPDGYCDVSSIILPINFSDQLVFSRIRTASEAPSTVEIEIQRHHPDFNPSKNTIRTAIDLFQRATGVAKVALGVNVEKNIPMGGGFGGGSSNAIRTLDALNYLHGHILSESDYLRIAQQIGTDCSFFIKNCPQLARGRGDMLCPLPKSFCENLASHFLLIFRFPFSISTPWAYEQFKKNPIFNPNAKAMLEQILSSQTFENIAYNAFQDLIFAHYPEMRSLFETLKSHGYHPSLTGSGSGCFIIHRNKNFLEAAKAIISKYLAKPSLLELTTFKLPNK
jgi:4-diphosphocytidyl-2-C-methyl-D-erythritol kinase